MYVYIYIYIHTNVHDTQYDITIRLVFFQRGSREESLLPFIHKADYIYIYIYIVILICMFMCIIIRSTLAYLRGISVTIAPLLTIANHHHTQTHSPGL